MAPRIAICYWGLTRSTRLVYQTHFTNLYSVLEKAGYEVVKFVHTWRTATPTTQGIIDQPIVEEGHLLEPNAYTIEDQDEFFKTIQFSNYFDADLWNRVGDNRAHGEWNPTLILNHIFALESLRRVYAMVTDTYDFIFFVRPDMELLAPFPIEALAAMKPRDILLNDICHGEGYNDRFAVLRGPDAAPYANRIEGLAEFRRTKGRIVSEKYVKHCIDSHYNAPTMISFPMRRVRANGTVLPH